MPSSSKYSSESDKYFYDNQPVLICSDDLDWVEQQKLFQGDRFYLSETRIYYPKQVLNGAGKIEKSLVPFYDLCMMSMCSDAIIANSSLSWWGAWLQKNQNKKVITQSPWFGERLSFNNIKDLIPESWIVEQIPDERIQR